MTSMHSLVLVGLLLAATGLGFAAQDAKKPGSFVPAPRTDDWAIKREAECIKRATESAPVHVVFVGDSITQSWEDPGKAAWAKHIAPLGALNLGNSGDRTENVLWRLEKAPLTRLKAKHVVLLIGTNNLGHGTSNAQETLDGVKAVASRLAEQCPDATVHILEIFPRGERINAMRGDICQINQTLSTFGERKTLDDGKRSRLVWYPIGDRFLEPIGSIKKEIMPDALHLTPRGYEIWAEAIAPALKKYAR
ncbi:MAG: GDSL-type esterase/lipase family protein [Planctomycetota bacterium]